MDGPRPSSRKGPANLFRITYPIPGCIHTDGEWMVLCLGVCPWREGSSNQRSLRSVLHCYRKWRILVRYKVHALRPDCFGRHGAVKIHRTEATADIVPKASCLIQTAFCLSSLSACPALKNVLPSLTMTFGR